MISNLKLVINSREGHERKTRELRRLKESEEDNQAIPDEKNSSNKNNESMDSVSNNYELLIKSTVVNLFLKEIT